MEVFKQSVAQCGMHSKETEEQQKEQDGIIALQTPSHFSCCKSRVLFFTATP
jgi:hypothetical protein